MNHSRAFVPSIPLHKSSSNSITSSTSANTSKQRPSLSSTLSSHLPTPTGSASLPTLSTTITDVNTNTSDHTCTANHPSPAEWLRANETCLKSPKNALRVAYISEQHKQSHQFQSSKPISIPTKRCHNSNHPFSNKFHSTNLHSRNNNNNNNNNNNIHNHSNASPSISSSLSSSTSSISSSSSPTQSSTIHFSSPSHNCHMANDVLNNFHNNNLTTSNSKTIPIASSPSSGLSRSSMAQGIPRVSRSNDIMNSTPPSYCPVGFDIKYAGNELDSRICYLGPVARNKVMKAIEIAKSSNICKHILAENITVALIVADLQMDCDTVCAAILRTIINNNNEYYDEEFIEQQVGYDVIKILTFHKQLEESVNLCVDVSFTEMSFSNLRELILVRAVEEHRAISLELARAVLAIRTIDTLPNEEQKTLIARRTMYLYAPLANQLGIWYIQSELEELAFMYLDANSFEMIRHLVGERRRECEDMLKESKQFLERILSQTIEIRNLIRTVHIKGRVKGLYSVYRKMRKSGKKVFEIYDLLALRVVVQPKKADEQAEKDACYAIRNVIHQYYETFESRAKDYIKEPKRNGYRSLHMTVLPHGGSTPLEIQIRTEKMHHVAEFGAAAHWIYKESSTEEEEEENVEEENYDMVNGLNKLTFNRNNNEEMEVEVNIKGNDGDKFDSELELDSDVESIVSDSDSEGEEEGSDNFMFFNFEEANTNDDTNESVKCTTSKQIVNDNTLEKSTVNEHIDTVQTSKENKSDKEDDDDDDDKCDDNDNDKNDNNMGSNGNESSSSSFLNVLGRTARHSVIATTRSKYRRSLISNNESRRKLRVGKSTLSNKYPRPRVPVRYNMRICNEENQEAKKQMEALELKRQSIRRHGCDMDGELRSGYITCLASAIRASRVIVSTAGQLYGLNVGSTLMDLASRLGVATLGAIAVVNGQIVPLTQRLNMNDIVQFINL